LRILLQNSFFSPDTQYLKLFCAVPLNLKTSRAGTILWACRAAIKGNLTYFFVVFSIIHNQPIFMHTMYFLKMLIHNTQYAAR
jgi:hypothetical protein